MFEFFWGSVFQLQGMVGTELGAAEQFGDMRMLELKPKPSSPPT